MKRRVARLLETGQDPKRVLALTFTRNAAADLITDLHGLGIEGCEKVEARTLHSFCFSLLMREEVFAHLQRVPRPIITFPKAGSLQFEGSGLLADLMLANPSFGGKRECTKRINAFEAAWARLQSEQPGWPRDDVDRQFQDAMIDWLRFHKAMLIGELVPLATLFLRDNPLANVLSAYDHIIVDEYQDLNRSEQEFIDQLAGHCAVAVVGDPNQSIYGFKYANPEGISQFNSRHPDTHDETLLECHRCPSGVVKIANAVISHNKSSQPLLQISPSNLAGEVHLVQWPSAREEAEGISNYIRHLVQNRGYAPGEILVLTPRRTMAYQIRDLLKNNNISCRSFFHEEALESAVAKHAFAKLALFVNPDDRVALRWWLGQGNTSERSKPYKALQEHCKSYGISPREALDALESGALEIPKTASLVTKYKELNDQISGLIDLSISDLIDHLFPPDEEGLAVLREVALLNIADCVDAASMHKHLSSHITNPAEITDESSVRIMSLYKSKGLTSKVAIVTGCSQGLIPLTLFEGKTPSEMEEHKREQRRLFYVAITRCKEILIVSSFLNIPYTDAKKLNIKVASSGAIGRTIASEFISEMGPSAPKSRNGFEWIASNYR